MQKKNLKIRETAKQKGVYLWQIAEALNICEMTFSKRLRKELPETEQQKIFKIIDELAKK